MAWVRRTHRELVVATAVVTTLMIQPYLVYYDLTWLLLPVIYVCARANARHQSLSLAATDRAIVALA